MKTNRFDYQEFVKNLIDSHTSALMPSGMLREAITAGAPDRGEILRKRLRVACDGLANLKGYKRTREKGVTGYLYQQVENS